MRELIPCPCEAFTDSGWSEEANPVQIAEYDEPIRAETAHARITIPVCRCGHSEPEHVDSKGTCTDLIVKPAWEI